MERAIFTNMCMIYDGDKVLVQDRKDPKWPGVTFPGGHVEPEESFMLSAIREVKEETGLDVRDLQFCGLKQFTDRDKDYRYVVFLYKTDKFCGELRSSEEGEVFWVNRQELCQCRMARSFEQMLEVFENEDVAEIFYWHDQDADEWRSETV